MSLLLEAMTHPSYMETSHVACYQRLEFLGDALIDWIITRHFFDEHKGKDFENHGRNSFEGPSLSFTC